MTQAGDELDKLPPEGGPQDEAPDISRLVGGLKEALKEQVADVRASTRLVESAVALAAGEHGPDLHMQRLMRRSGRAFAGKPVLEINPRHPWITALAARAEAGGDLAADAALLLDLARVQDGEAPSDPAGFVRRVAAALAAA